MAILSTDRIALNAQAADKTAAIRLAGDLLVKAGCVRPAYVDGMLAREQSMTTCLGNGVAIPHGIYENRDDILRTGLSVVQLPAGVAWDDGERVQLVVGIAAQADEHVGVLANLAEVIENEATLAQLLQTGDPEVIVTLLSAPPAA